jgi:hypothetical protein
VNDFNHWDYADEFSGRDAAYLIGGINPSSNNAEDSYRALPIIKRMKKAYYSSCSDYRDDFEYLAEDDRLMFSRNTKNPSNLLSCEIETLIKNYENSEYVKSGDSFHSSGTGPKLVKYQDDEGNEVFLKDLDDKGHDAIGPGILWKMSDHHEFDDQYFSRSELRRWLADNKFPTKYHFLDRNELSSAGRALSTTERNTLLTIIAALCNYSDIKHDARGVAPRIEGMTTDIGATVTADSILKVLRQIPAALESRTR